MENPGKFGFLIAILFELALIGLGILLIRKNSKDKKKAAESLAWPTILGRVTCSQVEVSESSDEDGTSYTYTPHIEYAYILNGQTYTSNQVAFGGVTGTGNTKKSQLVVNQYPLNAVVKVFFNPANPNEAVLEQVTGSGAKGALIGGIVLVVIGVLMALPMLIILLG
jgi:hypothetical protein